MTTTLICEWCGDEFERPKPHGPVPKFCKPSHRQRAFESRRIANAVDRALEAKRSSSGSAMRGWEAFGVAPVELGYRDEKGPTVRRLGTDTVRVTLTPQQERELEDWPEAELHGGVAHISISAWGDDIRGAYVKVAGPDRDAVEAAWHRVAALIPLDVWS